jgi:hypothetical protein
MDITDFRKQYPEYDGVDDSTLVKQLHEKYYSDTPIEDFSKAFNPYAGKSTAERTFLTEGAQAGTARMKFQESLYQQDSTNTFGNLTEGDSTQPWILPKTWSIKSPEEKFHWVISTGIARPVFENTMGRTVDVLEPAWKLYNKAMGEPTDESLRQFVNRVGDTEDSGLIPDAVAGVAHFFGSIGTAKKVLGKASKGSPIYNDAATFGLATVMTEASNLIAGNTTKESAMQNIATNIVTGGFFGSMSAIPSKYIGGKIGRNTAASLAVFEQSKIMGASNKEATVNALTVLGMGLMAKEPVKGKPDITNRGLPVEPEPPTGEIPGAEGARLQPSNAFGEQTVPSSDIKTQRSLQKKRDALVDATLPSLEELYARASNGDEAAADAIANNQYRGAGGKRPATPKSTVTNEQADKIETALASEDLQKPLVANSAEAKRAQEIVAVTKGEAVDKRSVTGDNTRQEIDVAYQANDIPKLKVILSGIKDTSSDIYKNLDHLIWSMEKGYRKEGSKLVLTAEEAATDAQIKALVKKDKIDHRQGGFVDFSGVVDFAYDAYKSGTKGYWDLKLLVEKELGKRAIKSYGDVFRTVQRRYQDEQDGIYIPPTVAPPVEGPIYIPPKRQTWTSAIKESVLDTLGDTTRVAHQIGAPLDARLADIDPKLKGAVYRLQYNLDHDIARYETASQEWITKLDTLKKASPDDFEKLKFGLNSQSRSIAEQVLQKYGMQESFESFDKLRQELKLRAVDAGYPIEEIDFYYHRKAKDVAKLQAYVLSENVNPIREAITTLESQRKRSLTPDEADGVTNMLLRGYSQAGIKMTPGATKARTIHKYTPDMNRLYLDPQAAALDLVRTMLAGIHTMKFFGKEPVTVKALRTELSSIYSKVENPKITADEFISLAARSNEIENQLRVYGNTSIEDSIGHKVNQLLISKSIKPEDGKALADIFNAYFKPNPPGKAVRTIASLIRIFTLNGIRSTLTQLQSGPAQAIHEGELGNYLRTVGGALKNLGYTINQEDYGIRKSGRGYEYADTGFMAAIENLNYTITGFKYTDIMDKLNLGNTVYLKTQQLAKAKDPTFIKYLDEIFAGNKEEVKQALDDLANGRKTDLSVYPSYAKVLDVHPIAKSGMSEAYLKAGNARLFFTLQTYSLKQFSYLKREIYNNLRSTDPKLKAKGWNAIAVLLPGLVAGYTAKQTAWHALTNQEDKPLDNFIYGTLQLFPFMSRYTLNSILTGDFESAISLIPVPPVAGGIVQDIAKEEFKRTKRGIPVVGELLYQRQKAAESNTGGREYRDYEESKGYKEYK